MSTPKYQLYITTDNKLPNLSCFDKRINLGRLSIAYSLNDNIVTKYEDENIYIMLLGHVIIDDKIQNSKVITFIKDGLIDKYYRSFNGLWLIIYYDKLTVSLTIINDRYASYPLYHNTENDDLHISLNYMDIFDATYQRRRLDKYAFYEFLSLRRLMGEKTYDTAIVYLQGASKITYNTSNKRFTQQQYWQPDFTKSHQTQSELGERLIETLENAVRRRLTDGKRYGLLLSGGVDSRVVLMTANSPITAFTNCDWENNEYDVAREAANYADQEHLFIKRPSDYFEQQKKTALKYTGSMYPLCEAGWLIPDYYEPMYSKVDALFHGCGLDYLIGDNYTPHNSFRLGPYIFYTRTLRSVNNNLPDDFMNTISWRFKDFSHFEWFNSDSRNKIKDYLRNSLSDVMSRGLQYTQDLADLYLYFTIHNPSRHLMYFAPMMIRAYVDERCPGWDNDYFDFCLSLPHKYRSNWHFYRRALSERFPEFMSMREATTNFPATLSPVAVDISKLWHGLLCKAGIRRRRPYNSRSWPVMDTVPTPPFHTSEAEALLMDNLPELSRLTIRKVMQTQYETIAKNLLYSVYLFLKRLT